MGLPTVDGNAAQACSWKTVHKVAYTGTQGRISAAVNSRTRLVRVWCSTDAHVAVGGSSVAATTDDTPVTAKIAEVLEVTAGVSYVSAIRQSENGTLYVTELQ